MGNIKVESQTNLYLEYSEGIEMSCRFPLLGLSHNLHVGTVAGVQMRETNTTDWGAYIRVSKEQSVN